MINEEKMESTEETDQTYHSYENDERLSKRLAYLLRYGAEKEGLDVLEGGWVYLMELTKVPMMKWYTIYQLMKEVINSRSHRGMCRYEKKHSNGIVYVRAVYGRRMERNPCHNGTQVGRLLELCMDKICDDLDTYDLEDFPDEFLINSMIHKLRRQKRLNNKVFRSLLSNTIEHLDLGAVYLTEGTIKLVGQRCPNVKLLILRDCGYLLTDTLMEWLLKRSKNLESLNIANCHHLTDRTITALCKHCKNIQQLNLSGVPSISQEGILKLLTIPQKLHHLDIFDNKNITPTGKSTIEQIAEERKVTVILKGLESQQGSEDLNHEASTALPMASVGGQW